MNQEQGYGGPLKITAADLARTLGANALRLVGDGEGFKVLHRSLISLLFAWRVSWVVGQVVSVVSLLQMHK
jgi:hypothetical protein